MRDFNHLYNVIMANMSCGLIYFIAAVILGFYIGFREEIKDLIQELFGTKFNSTAEKEEFDLQYWWAKEISEEDREEALKALHDPLGLEADLNNSGDENGETIQTE